MSYKRIRGCLEDLPKPVTIPALGQDIEIERCPRKYVDGPTLMMLAAYREYKNGFLPNPGGWLDQPMKFIQSMQIVDSVISKLEEAEDGR